jgi:hypothetical protein
VLRRIFPAIFLLSLATFLPAQTPDTSQTKPANVSGKWEMSWQGRMGTEKCTLDLQQDANKLKGTFQDQRGPSQLTGTIDGKTITFEVKFQGARPFTTKFTGTVDNEKIEGKSQAMGVGGSGAFLGHGGEVQQPEHPWTANRPTQSTGASQNSAKN